MNFFILLCIIALPFIFLGFIFWLKSAEKRKLDKLQTDLYLDALEKGLEIPPDLFNKPKRTNYFWETGLVLIAIGIGISLWLIFIALISPKVSIIRFAVLVPFFSGIGFLISYFIWKKKR
jgi:hypothetical protein